MPSSPLQITALAAITLYQRYLSPYKGYRCAYRVHTGCASCSTLGYRAIRRYGAFHGVKVLQGRFERCAAIHQQHAQPRPALPSQAGYCEAPAAVLSCLAEGPSALQACGGCADIGPCMSALSKDRRPSGSSLINWRWFSWRKHKLRIAQADPHDKDSQILLSALNAALLKITGDSGASSFDADDMRDPRALFVIARTRAAGLQGCGALRPMQEGIAEIKRMYAVPDSKGVGSAILKYLEQHARNIGYREIRLSTRLLNQRAVDFYLRHGYQQIDNFGNYANRPESICFAKQF